MLDPEESYYPEYTIARVVIYVALWESLLSGIRALDWQCIVRLWSSLFLSMPVGMYRKNYCITPPPHTHTHTHTPHLGSGVGGSVCVGGGGGFHL